VTDRPTDRPAPDADAAKAPADTNASQKPDPHADRARMDWEGWVVIGRKPDPHADRVQATYKLPADTCAALRELVGRIAKVRALVVGDGIGDCYHEIAIDRENPEAPGSHVYNFVRSTTRPGGASAVAAMVGAIQGPDSPRLIEAIGTHRPLKTRFGTGYLPVAGQVYRREPPQCVMRQDRPLFLTEKLANTGGALHKLTEKGITGTGWAPKLGDDPRPPDVIILSDYAQGVVEQPVLDHLRDYLRSQLAQALADGRDPAIALPIVIIDPRRAELIDQALVDQYRRLADFDDSESRTGMGGPWLWMTPNRSETQKLLELNPGSWGQRGSWGHLPTMLCTDGENPVRTIVDWETDTMFLPIRQFRPIDPCGCGDQFAATFGLALAAIRQSRSKCGATCLLPRRSVKLAIQLAQLAAGLQTQRIGATPIRAAELLDEIDRVEED